MLLSTTKALKLFLGELSAVLYNKVTLEKQLENIQIWSMV
jgi:hypothetical protein